MGKKKEENPLAMMMMGGEVKDNKSYKELSSKPKNYKNNSAPRKNNISKVEDDRYVGAPYNFVPFTQKEYEYSKEQLPTHDSMNEELISGELVYEMTAETDIFVDDGTDAHHFNKNAKGQYSIQGSSVRGLIRNNVQILGFSSIVDDIDDYALMYRNVAGGAERERYNTILGNAVINIGMNPKTKKPITMSILKNVKAGYIRQENGQYFIYQTCVDKIDNKYEDMNYYILSEKKIIEDYKLYKKENKKDFQYDFFIQKNEILQNTLQSTFPKVMNKRGNPRYIGIKNTSYKPYYHRISYLKTGIKTVTAVGKPEKYKTNGNQGYVISSGFMNDKKAVYIIPEIDETKEKIIISPKDVEAFKVDIEKRKNTLKQFGGRDFFDLPAEGETKPVFYIRLDGKLYFGFTPRLRLFYDYTVKDGLKERKNTETIDFAKAMFGYSNEKESYKSRLSFSDAIVKNQSVTENGVKKVILSEPKPTSYMDYLNQDKYQNAITYNTRGFQLRGVKQYWLHQSAGENIELNDKEKVSSGINALPRKTVFTGKVRFKNLTEEELGLLLWAIRLEKKSQMNIGKAKAYGYGRVSVIIKSAKKINLQKSYKECILDLDPFEDIDVDKEIAAYKEFIAKSENLESVEKSLRISSFLAMKDSTKIPNKNDIRYMHIGEEREYQNRTKPLPTVNQIIKK